VKLLGSVEKHTKVELLCKALAEQLRFRRFISTVPFYITF